MLTLYRYVVLVFDEMKIQEDLVFNKHTGMITGFVDYGQQSLDQRFSALTEECSHTLTSSKRTIASHMLTMMVRGIFLNRIFHLHSSQLQVRIFSIPAFMYSLINRCYRQLFDVPSMESCKNVADCWPSSHLYYC